MLMGEDSCPEVIDEYLMVKACESCVLLMDGDASIRILRSRSLGKGGFEAFHPDGIEALEKLQNTLPKIIISDLEMSRRSGLEFIEVGRWRFPSIGGQPSGLPTEQARFPH